MIFLWTIISLLILNFQNEAGAQTSDFFSNTQAQGKVSTGSSGSCPNCPGFNPTLAGGLLKHVDISQCPDAATSPCVPPFFSSLGSGAVTDNMFGAVSSATRESGVDGLLGTADDTFSRCGTVAGLAGLNCGNIRFDPTSQGMALPTGANSLNQIDRNITFDSDLFPSTDNHLGLLLTHNFSWKNPSLNACGGSASPPTPPSGDCTQASFNLLQVGPLVSGQVGTRAIPGPGEQVADLRVSWLTSNTSETAFDAPLISWNLTLVEPSTTFFNPTPGTPASTLPCLTTSGLSPFLIQCGSFTYNSDASFPQMNFPLGASSSASVQGTVP